MYESGNSMLALVLLVASTTFLVVDVDAVDYVAVKAAAEVCSASNVVRVFVHMMSAQYSRVHYIT